MVFSGINNDKAEKGQTYRPKARYIYNDWNRTPQRNRPIYIETSLFCVHPRGSKPIYFTYILRYIIALQQISLGFNQDNHSEYRQTCSTLKVASQCK